ncbi:hypothetical protein WA026_021131 [Henosepilachna vigintioctopunctata]|uniref:Uncharacterized protein n=1 Tax=Henosepilachna vigintioctopunctata TaxID=420089 RepID=A0AAW1UB23_9CUCU
MKSSELKNASPIRLSKHLVSNNPSQEKDVDDIPLTRMVQSTDEDDNIPLAKLVAQLQKSTATEQRIEIEEFIGIDDNVTVCALAAEE